MTDAAIIQHQPALASGTTGQQQLLTPEEVARMLRVPVETLAEWRRARSSHCPISAVYVGKRPRYRPADVEALMNGALTS